MAVACQSKAERREAMGGLSCGTSRCYGGRLDPNLRLLDDRAVEDDSHATLTNVVDLVMR